MGTSLKIPELLRTEGKSIDGVILQDNIFFNDRKKNLYSVTVDSCSHDVLKVVFVFVIIT